MNGALEGWLRRRPLYDGLAADAHPERWAAAGVPPEVARKLMACPRSVRTVSRDPGFLLPEFGANLTVCDPLAEVPGWALFSGELLWRIGLRFGAGRFHREIAGLVWRQDVDAVKLAVGEDAHRFALRQAPVLRRRLPSPDGEGGTTGDELGGAAIRTAGLGFGCALAELPLEIAGRVLAKLPPTYDGPAEEARSWPADRRGQWAAFFRGLLETSPA